MIVTAPAKLKHTTINLPLSKSVANRLMVISHLAGNSIDDQPTDSDDSIIMKRLLEQLEAKDNRKVYDAGHAGTVFRFLSAILALTPGDHVLTGSERMQQRPCRPLVEALRALGADIKYLANEGYPPLKITGSKLKGGSIEIDSSVSSQFISALLMISPYIEGGLELLLTGNTVSTPYILMTIGLMRKCGITVSNDNRRIQVSQGQYLVNDNLNEADWSAASYWYTLVAFVEGSQITLGGLNENSFQGDKALVGIYNDMGVKSEWQGNKLVLSYSGNQKSGLSINLLQNPDLAPSIAVACAGLNVEAELTGLETLVIKESNRLEAIVTELTKLGYSCYSKNNNGLIITSNKSGVTDNFIRTYSDHRIAMSMSLLATRVGQLVIEEPAVVNKSYPDFWNDLEKVGFKLNR